MRRSTRQSQQSKAKKAIPVVLQPLEEDPSASLPRFTCFPKLPTEIQEQIWLESIVPRWVQINNFFYHCIDSWFNHSNCSDPIPVLSKICRHSRKIFLREYYLYIPFQRTFQRNGRPYKGNEPCWVNPTVDTVYLCMDNVEAETHDRNLAEKGSPETEMERLCRTLGKWMEKETTGRPEVLRNKWHIRKLALPAGLIESFKAYPEKKSLSETEWMGYSKDPSKRYDRYGMFKRENFPGLEEVIFVETKFSGRFPKLVESPDAIMQPESGDELQSWEDLMAMVGRSKELIGPNDKFYQPWLGMSVGIVYLRQGEKRREATIDKSDSLVRLGPWNTEWNCQRARFRQQEKARDEKAKAKAKAQGQRLMDDFLFLS